MRILLLLITLMAFCSCSLEKKVIVTTRDMNHIVKQECLMPN